MAAPARIRRIARTTACTSAGIGVTVVVMRDLPAVHRGQLLVALVAVIACWAVIETLVACHEEDMRSVVRLDRASLEQDEDLPDVVNLSHRRRP